MGALAAILAVAYPNLGLPVLFASVAVLLIFQHLTVALMRSEDRADQLEARSIQLASLQLGVLTTLMDALALRDRTTARHAAASPAMRRRWRSRWAATRRSRRSSTPPACSTILASSRGQTASCTLITQGRGPGDGSTATLRTERHSWASSTATARSPTRSFTTTSGLMAAAIRQG